ncbi:MAG: protein kinase [Ardenticatenaceae bacterium]|nr:protein kinase [Ardenticatenaceae bacterium]
MTLTKFGRYEINKVLGQGGMAEVYEAHDPVIERPVALKIIRKNYSDDVRFKQRFRREANIIANLEHRAILPVYDFGEDEKTGQLFLVMRLMPDVLNYRIERDGPISLEETSRILNRLAAALAKAHGRGIVHRDIKPANILLDSDGTTFLSDFGLAAFAAKIETSQVPSSYGGSPFYMAPEQWLDEKVGTHTDVYQLGVTLFEMLTGKRPFPETDMIVLQDRHINTPIPTARDINPKLPRNIEPILEKAMAKNPLDRYQTPLDLADAIAALLRPERIKNRYEIKEELQHGRLAVVYLARDLFKDQDVALKVMKHKLIRNLAYQQRFEQEKQIVTNVQHQAFVPVYDIDQHEGRPYLAMRFMEGASLRERFRKELASSKDKDSDFSVDTICRLAEHLAQGLEAVHQTGKAHGEINLGNVLLDATGNWYLADFHMLDVAELTEVVLEQEAPLGYLPYLTPEQWRGESPTPKTDVYQFAMMLFELLTGQRPFPDMPAPKLRQAVENDSLPKVTSLKPELPPKFDTIFAKAMAKKPQDRFASASEVVSRLNQARENHTFETLKQQGDDCYKEKHWDEAIAAYNKALEIRPYDSAVQASLDRAERRKTESGIFHRGQLAIDENRWEDAAFFLQQIPSTPETDDLLEHVQQNILIERQYDEGKAAMLRQEWIVAKHLLEETDRLEPNYRDVNKLLGQLAEKISEILQQAQNAADQAKWAEAFSLLDSVDGEETAVALREEFVTQQRQAGRTGWWWSLTRNEKITIVATAVTLLGIIITLITFFPGLFTGGGETAVDLTPDEKIACLQKAESSLLLTYAGEPDIELMQGETGNIRGDGQLINLLLQWGPADLSESCHEFIAGLASEWQATNGELEAVEPGKYTYRRSSLSYDKDRIVVTLSYQDQELSNTFLLNFAP